MTSREKQCDYPGCFRYRNSPIHLVDWGCKRCAKDGGHVYWNSYLSVNRFRPKLGHHNWLKGDATGGFVIPKVVADEIVAKWGGGMPDLEGITYDD